jgi:muramoyltetrapeptide carboxypeptidase
VPTALRRPPPLAPGARVALVSPAGPLRGEADLARAVANARAFGWEPSVGAHALARRGYFAGDDAARLADLNAALADDAIDAVWCVRGGYGAMRLLPGVDYDALRRRPKPIVGYSDVTALHAAAGRVAGLVSYHGPTARAELTGFTRASLERAVTQRGEPCGPAADASRPASAPAPRTLRGGRARGVLAGGNLALVAALTGTPYAPRLDEAILVLEDVNEAVYRVDRMLRQLLLAGALAGVRGIAFGRCTACPEESDDGARTLAEVVAEIADALAVPCALHLPVGHIDDQWTVPLGAVAELDADALTLTVER